MNAATCVNGAYAEVACPLGQYCDPAAGACVNDGVVEPDAGPADAGPDDAGVPVDADAADGPADIAWNDVPDTSDVDEGPGPGDVIGGVDNEDAATRADGAANSDDGAGPYSGVVTTRSDCASAGRSGWPNVPLFLLALVAVGMVVRRRGPRSAT